MIKGKSKFDSDIFFGYYDNWGGFNKQKYSKEQAIEAWRTEMFGFDKEAPCVVEDAFTRYRFGQNEDHEPCVGWWLEWKDYGNKSVPVWSIRSPYPWEKDGSVEEAEQGTLFEEGDSSEGGRK